MKTKFLLFLTAVSITFSCGKIDDQEQDSSISTSTSKNDVHDKDDKLKEKNKPYYGIEFYCNNKECLKYQAIQSVEKKIGESVVYQVEDLDNGCCPTCRNNKVVRFCFRNCKAKIRHENNARRIVEFDEIIASDANQYFYPEIEDIKKIRVTTEKKP